MPNLVDRRHEQTRATIAEAAVRLFIERGFVETTMDDVAEAAGVSRRTAYRHFPSKDDLVFEEPRRWLQHFREQLETRGPGEPLRDLIRRCLLSVADVIQAGHVAVLAAFSVLVATPSLRARHGRSNDEWFACYAALLHENRPAAPGEAVEIATVAGSLVGTTNALVGAWAMEQPGSDMRAMLRIVLDRLDGIWPEWSRQTA